MARESAVAAIGSSDLDGTFRTANPWLGPATAEPLGPCYFCFFVVKFLFGKKRFLKGLGNLKTKTVFEASVLFFFEGVFSFRSD